MSRLNVVTKKSRGHGQRLTRERILRAAIAMADRAGVDAVTMRGLGSELGVEGMALYRHFATKDELLEAMVDLLVGDITAPRGGGPWRSAIRALALSARTVFGGRRWAQRLLATRLVLGPGTLGHIEAVTRALRDAGFSYRLQHNAMHVLGARIFGFTQEPFDDALTPEAVQRFAALIRAGDYPAMNEALPSVRHEADAEFQFGLDLVLDALERARRNAARRARTPRSG
jgi:AcrR family transcriptional regulator